MRYENLLSSVCGVTLGASAVSQPSPLSGSTVLLKIKNGATKLRSFCSPERSQKRAKKSDMEIGFGSLLFLLLFCLQRENDGKGGGIRVQNQKTIVREKNTLCGETFQILSHIPFF